MHAYRGLTPGRFLLIYTAKDVVMGFLLGTGIFLFILLMFQAIRLSEFVVVHQVAIKDVMRLSVYLLLSFVPIAVPISLLFSVLMGISRANTEGELLAFQVNGISLQQLFIPVGLFSTVVTALCLYAALYSVPRGNRLFELLITKLGSERVMANLKPGVFMEGFYGLVLFAEQIVPLKNEMKQVFIYDRRDEMRPLAITAEAGVLKAQPDKGLLTLRLTNGAIHVENFDPKGVQQKLNFEVYDINLEVARPGEGWRSYSPPSYNLTQLNERIRETESDQPHQRQLKVELHRRFSMAFSCIVFGVLGFLIGSFSQRGIRSTAILFCIAVGVVYWLAFLAANAMASSGVLLPWVAVWAPNLFFLAISLFLYSRLKRN